MSTMTCLVCFWRGAVPAWLAGYRVACPRCGAERHVPRDEAESIGVGWRPVAAPGPGAPAARGVAVRV